MKSLDIMKVYRADKHEWTVPNVWDEAENSFFQEVFVTKNSMDAGWSRVGAFSSTTTRQNPRSVLRSRANVGRQRLEASYSLRSCAQVHTIEQPKRPIIRMLHDRHQSGWAMNQLLRGDFHLRQRIKVPGGMDMTQHVDTPLAYLFVTG